MQNELKPCYHCASSDVRVDFYQGSEPLAVCSNCGFSTFLYDWNIRPIEDTLRAEDEKLRARGAVLEELSQYLIDNIRFIPTPKMDHIEALVQKLEALK